MTEAIPLGADLRIKANDVVAHRAARPATAADLVLQRRSPVAGCMRGVEGPVERDAYAGADLTRRDSCDGGRQKVQHAQLVCGSE